MSIRLTDDDQFPHCPECETNVLVAGNKARRRTTVDDSFECYGCGLTFNRDAIMSNTTPTAPTYLTATCVECNDGQAYRTFKLSRGDGDEAVAVYACEDCGHEALLDLDPERADEE